MTAKEEATLLYREFLNVSIFMDFEDARQCALIHIRKQKELLANLVEADLMYILKRERLCELETEILLMNFCDYYNNQQPKNPFLNYKVD